MLIPIAALFVGLAPDARTTDLAPAAAPAPLAVASVASGTDRVDELLATGRRALIEGDGAAALEAFTAAHTASPSLRTEVWVVRGQVATGALDEAFEKIIELDASHDATPVLSYGVGAVRYALGKREEGMRGGNPGAAYEEALAYLVEATDAEPDEYPDAWRMIAESARWMGQIDVAASAIDRALEIKKDAGTYALASKIRVASGVALLGEEATIDAGKRAIEQGIADAAAAAEAFGDDRQNAAQVADVHLQRGVGLLFLERKDDAAKAYAAAMAWDPTQVDYGQLMGSFTDEEGTLAPYVAMLKSGAEGFERRWGKDLASDAGLHWWRGYAEHRLGRDDAAIVSMETALRKFPAYSNARWYIGVSNFNKGKDTYPQAVDAWAAYADADLDGFVAMVNADARNKYYVQKAQAVLYGNGRPQPGTVHAARLSELLLLTDETSPLHWNDVGLMHRDAGAYVARAAAEARETPEAREAPAMSAQAHFERAWEAYSRALELDRKSYYLNDGAVILHYYLERDYPLAFEMYDEAEALAQKELAAEPSDDERPLIEIALRDAKDNRAKLKAKIENKKKRDQDGQKGGARQK